VRCVDRFAVAENVLRDVVSRYGGEEFAILLPQTTEENALLWANRIRERLAGLAIRAGGRNLQVTASFGVAERMSDTASPEQLVDMADQALIVAKRSGRDRCVAFQELNDNRSLASSSSPAELLQNVSARQVMTTLVAGLDQDDTVEVASRYFLRFRIAIAPVINAAGTLVGVLSEKDVMAAMLQPEWWKLRIANVMKANVVCYEEETPALAIYEFLCRVTLRAAVIVKHGIPTGLITRGSLLRFFTNALAVQGHLLGDGASTFAATNERTGASEARRRILQTVAAVGDEALDLQQRLDEAQADLVPSLVGGASRIQELANDLLACSRLAGESANTSEQPLLLG
jgi:CBS-domain-containing membrane protein